MMILTVLEKLAYRPQINNSFPRHRTPEERKIVDHSSRRQADQPWSFPNVQHVRGNRCCLRHLRSSLTATGKKTLIFIQRSVARFRPVIGDDHTYDPEGEASGEDDEEAGCRSRNANEDDTGTSARPVAKTALIYAHTNLLLINSLASRRTKPLFSNLSLLEVLLATICGQA